MTELPAQKLSVTDAAMSRATKVGPKATIVDVRLVEHAAKAREVTRDSPSLMRTGHGHKVVREEDNRGIRVFVSFKTDVAHDTEESRQSPPITISATYALTYAVEDLASFDDEDLSAFAEINGMFNAWPFWRELFHSMMGRMGFEPSTMHTLRVETGKVAD